MSLTIFFFLRYFIFKKTLFEKLQYLKQVSLLSLHWLTTTQATASAELMSTEA